MPIKKIRFVGYYNRAREHALNENYIKAGWRRAGLFPWNPKKVLQLSQIFSNTITSTAPSKRPNSSSSLLSTPQNKRQLIEAQATLLEQADLPRGVRYFFNKTAKAFEQLHVERALNLQQINAQTTKLEEINQKKKKKVPINANELFAGIEKIKAAQEEQRRQIALSKEKDLAAEARKTAEQVMGMQIAQMSFQFSQFDPIE
jgi:hypothetical protein